MFYRQIAKFPSFEPRSREVREVQSSKGAAAPFSPLAKREQVDRANSRSTSKWVPGARATGIRQDSRSALFFASFVSSRLTVWRFGLRVHVSEERGQRPLLAMARVAEVRV